MATFKVKISGPGGDVIFQASSSVGESRTANYEGYNITHMPTDLWAYRNTTGRKFQINGKLVSRTPDEAGENAHYLNLIRQWILPDFAGTGATPPILKFSAYDNDNIDQVKVILKSYSFTFPDDIDYIFTGSVPMPVIASLNIDLDEAYSAEDINAKEWEIIDEAGGFFENGGAGKGSSSFDIDFQKPGGDSGGGGGGGFGGIATRGSGLPSAGSRLGSGRTSTGGGGFGGGAGIPSLNGARSQGNSLVVDVTSFVSSIENNPFIRGISPERLINDATAALTQVAGETIQNLADSFNRNDDLPVPDWANGIIVD